MTDGPPLRVVVADDQALVRVGFCGIIAATPGFAVVGEAANGAVAVEAARRTKPDVILMDVRMPVMNGIEATAPAASCSRTRCPPTCSPPSGSWPLATRCSRRVSPAA